MAIRLAALTLVVLLAVGCHSVAAPPPHTGPPALTTTNDGYSLLYELLSKQADVDKALWFRTTPAEFAVIIKEIAKVSNEGAQQLAAFAAADKTIQLDLTPLPTAERETRAAIEASETHLLLTTTGTVFRRRLLLSQASSMQYAQHLAGTIAKHEAHAAHKAALEGMAARFQTLETNVIAQLSVDEVPAKK
jgi:hypothetical protein